MTCGSVFLLFVGNANADAESRIVNSGTNLQTDILKVGHHGSATSSSSAWVSKVQPKTNVIEVGAGNSYGPPTSATLGRQAQVGSAIYRNYLNGDVTVTTDGTTGRCQNRTGKQPAGVGICETGNHAADSEFAEFSRCGLQVLL
jgi:beta-lactamase superfamily II metal-dependent hydrolase